MKNRYLLIMAGGVGSRFWPLSRREKSKQFLDILGTGETLIQMTYRRFADICPPENIYVVTNEDSSDIVVSQLGIDPDHVLAELLRRNTAPCIWPDSPIARTAAQAAGCSARRRCAARAVAPHQTARSCSLHRDCGRCTVKASPARPTMRCASSSSRSLTSEVPRSMPR